MKTYKILHSTKNAGLLTQNKSNLKYIGADGEKPSSFSTSKSVCRISRDNTATFSIRQDCFICGKMSKRGEKLTQITTGTGDGTRNKVLSAASSRGDDAVKLRLIAHQDLFAYDAKYHRSCYSTCISDRNIKAARRKKASNTMNGISDKAFRDIVDDLERSVLSSQKSVTTLSKVTSDYAKNLLSHGASGEVYSWKLKERLKNHFQDKLVFLEQRGKSDLICSSKVSVGDALQKACELQKKLSDDKDLREDLNSEQTCLTESQILHSAAGILRSIMADAIKETNCHYDPSTSISVQQCAEYIPSLLYDFILWLTDTNAFTTLSNCAKVQKNNLNAIAICHNIISRSRQVITPLTLGLGLYIHHETGSRHIVEDLHSLGYSVSYDEIRRFLTSAAIDQRKYDIYIPKGLQFNDGSQIDGAIDNFDQNEQTLDGKSTTHAMASVIFSRFKQPKQDGTPLQRISQKAIGNCTEDTVIKRYDNVI